MTTPMLTTMAVAMAAGMRLVHLMVSAFASSRFPAGCFQVSSLVWPPVRGEFEVDG